MGEGLQRARDAARATRAPKAPADTTIRCAWCRTLLTPEDAKQIENARLPDLPDSENMQCSDQGACDRRQDALDAALILRTPDLGSLFIKETPEVLAAMNDGERLREARAILDAGL